MNYSGRWDLLRAIRELSVQVKHGEISPDEIDEEVLSSYLHTSYMTDPELLIRTSGEQRLSNFLLWECAYSEFHFTPVHWPDFRRIHLFEAILDYQGRQRRFGGA